MRPTNQASFQGVQPQRAPTMTYAMGGQPQPAQVPTSAAVPEAGKKKRLSTLGGLFSRTNAAGPAKVKMSKEEKKALRAGRHATAPPLQTSPQPWPPQQQQFRPQQPGMYPPGQGPPQSMYGMRPMGPQFASPVTMSPVSPQNLQGAAGMPQQRMSQHYQQYQQPHQGFHPQQAMSAAQMEQGSAYITSRQLAEEHRAQQQFAQQSGQGFRPVSQISSKSSLYVPSV